MDKSKCWPARESFFYGWVIVAAAFAISAVASGVTYAFPVFFDTLASSFGRNRAEISLIFSICIFVWFSTGLCAGILADKFGPRIVALLGCMFMASGLAIAGSSSSIYELYGAYGAGVGLGGGLMYIPAVSIVQRWFKRKRALASGLAVCGTGFGALVFPPIASTLTGDIGWRLTHYVFSATVIMVCGGASLAFVAHPSDIGQQPDGNGVTPQHIVESTSSGLTLREALATRSFWQLYLASLLSSAAVYITYVHLVPYSRDRGVSPDASVALISVLGVSSVCGRFLVGGLADRIGRLGALSLMFSGLSLTMIWWLMIPPSSMTLLIYAIAFGTLSGGYISILPALTMELFGGQRVASVIGSLYTSWGIGALCGPTFAGVVFDLRHSYFYAILCGAVAMALSAVSCSTIRSPESPY